LGRSSGGAFGIGFWCRNFVVEPIGHSSLSGREAVEQVDCLLVRRGSFGADGARLDYRGN
jgi:hypothetical protein